MNSQLIDKEGKIIFRRREFKFLISEKIYFILRQRLNMILTHDKGCSQEEGGYFVRSLYFDSISNQALFDKLGGYDPRKKYRIRIYDLGDNRGKFEIKAKRDNFIHKDSCWISRDEILKAQKGDYEWMKDKNNQNWDMVYHIFTTQMMRPVVIVDYIRDAFTFPIDNLRITFDKELSISPVNPLRGGSIFIKFLKTYQPMEGKVIMEIKFDGAAIPSHVKKLLNNIDAPPLAISKYVIGRMCFSDQLWQSY